MTKRNKKAGDNMAAVIERIIAIEQSESNEFIKMQKKRIMQLRAIEARMNQGKNIQKERIVVKLQKAGILDARGNLASPYSD